VNEYVHQLVSMVFHRLHRDGRRPSTMTTEDHLEEIDRVLYVEPRRRIKQAFVKTFQDELSQFTRR
jgi:hypothetical protein